jgi:hypothetical protein
MVEEIRPRPLLAIAAIAAALHLGAAARAEDDVETAAEPAPLVFGGPIELQDTFLPAQVRPQLYSEGAALLPEGAFSARVVGDWSNHFAKTDTYVFDGESVTSALRLRYAPWRRFEVGVDVPWASRFNGTLDPLIEDVEDALDARVRERFQTPRSRWNALVIAPNGTRRMRLLEGSSQGDVSLRGRFALARRDELGFDASLVASLGLPTGSDSFGGEGVTPGLGVDLQKSFDTVNLFGGASIQHFTDATEQDFRLAPWRWMTYAGVEWRPWGRWLGLLFQYQIYGPLARTNDPLDDPAHYYAGGFRVYLPAHVTLDAMAIENNGLVENRNSTDISFHFAVGWVFAPH